MTRRLPLTILFADVCGSTKLFDMRGDADAHRLIAGMLDAMSSIIESHGGRVVRTMGDGIKCAFPAPLPAMLAAVEMQKRIALDTAFASDRQAIRVGLHHGDALLEDNNDVNGVAVKVAEHMIGLAEREQIVTTASTVELLGNVDTLHTRQIGRTQAPRTPNPVDIVEMMWHEDAAIATIMHRAVRMDPAGAASERLVMRYRGRVLELDELSPPFTLGRDAACSLVVDAEWVSREHALIEYRRGYFMISDCSINGTYVTLGGDRELRLHRDKLHLGRSGLISLGRAMALNRDHVLTFRCGV
ncbi:MAG: adenylate/guanylate cyclase domain-containing protein [Rhodanobacteraceae bacterium]